MGEEYPNKDWIWGDAWYFKKLTEEVDRERGKPEDWLDTLPRDMQGLWGFFISAIERHWGFDLCFISVIVTSEQRLSSETRIHFPGVRCSSFDWGTLRVDGMKSPNPGYILKAHPIDIFDDYMWDRMERKESK